VRWRAVRCPHITTSLEGGDHLFAEPAELGQGVDVSYRNRRLAGLDHRWVGHPNLPLQADALQLPCNARPTIVGQYFENRQVDVSLARGDVVSKCLQVITGGCTACRDGHLYYLAQELILIQNARSRYQSDDDPFLETRKGAVMRKEHLDRRKSHGKIVDGEGDWADNLEIMQHLRKAVSARRATRRRLQHPRVM